MRDDQRRTQSSTPEEAGHPGTGAGRRDEPGRSGVYPFGSPGAPADADQVVAGRWGQGEEGSYEDHGESELRVPRPASSGKRDDEGPPRS